MTSLATRMPFSGNRRQSMTPQSRLQIVWLLLATSLSSFILAFILDGRSPAMGYLLNTMSCVSCGLSWLFSRELFANKDKQAMWPYGLVSALFLAAVTLSVSSNLGLERDGFLGVLNEITKLISSTVLLLPFFEAIDGYGRQKKTERQFRRWFLIGYAGILGTATVLAIPTFSAIEYSGQVLCCIVALTASRLALLHRNRLTAESANAKSSDRESVQLSASITTLLVEDQVFLDPEIKVSDLARRLRQPDYKVTRCITQQLGFRNFNQMINGYRIEEAKRMLSDSKYDDQSILTIAMESGFGSIGPFNRSFKQCTGLTPIAYRRMHSRAVSRNAKV